MYRRNRYLAGIVVSCFLLLLGPAVSSGSTRSTVLLDEARKLYFTNKLEDAIGKYERVVGEFPESKEASYANYEIGLCLYELGDVGKALSQFEYVITTFPDAVAAVEARIMMTRIFAEIEEYAPAIRMGQELLEEFPDQPPIVDFVSFFVVKSFEAIGKPGMAISLLDNGIEVLKERTGDEAKEVVLSLYSLKAEIEVNRANLPEAIRILTAVTEEYPSLRATPELLVQLGYYYFDLEEFTAAEQTYARILNDFPQFEFKNNVQHHLEAARQKLLEQSHAITLTIWSPEPEEPLLGILRTFEILNPRVKVVLEAFPPEVIREKLLVALLLEGNVADVVVLPSEILAEFADREALLRVDAIIGADLEIMGRYADTPSLSRTLIYDRRIYGIPFEFSPQVMFYNQGLFDKMGILRPYRTWSWDEFLEKAVKLTVPHESQFGFSLGPIRMENMYHWILQNGGALISEDYRKSLIRSDETFEALKWLWNLTHEHRVTPPSVATPQFSVEQFIRGRCAMFVGNVNDMFLIEESSRVPNWDIAPLPEGKLRANWLSSTDLTITKWSRHPKEAWQLVKNVNESVPEFSVTKWIRSGDFLFAIPPPPVSIIYLKSPHESENILAFREEIAFAEPFPMFPEFFVFESIIADKLGEAWMKKLSLREAIEAVNKEMEELLSHE